MCALYTIKPSTPTTETQQQVLPCKCRRAREGLEETIAIEQEEAVYDAEAEQAGTCFVGLKGHETGD